MTTALSNDCVHQGERQDLASRSRNTCSHFSHYFYYVMCLRSASRSGQDSLARSRTSEADLHLRHESTMILLHRANKTPSFLALGAFLLPAGQLSPQQGGNAKSTSYFVVCPRAVVHPASHKPAMEGDRHTWKFPHASGAPTSLPPL